MLSDWRIVFCRSPHPFIRWCPCLQHSAGSPNPSRQLRFRCGSSLAQGVLRLRPFHVVIMEEKCRTPKPDRILIARSANARHLEVVSLNGWASTIAAAVKSVVDSQTGKQIDLAVSDCHLTAEISVHHGVAGCEVAVLYDDVLIGAKVCSSFCLSPATERSR